MTHKSTSIQLNLLVQDESSALPTLSQKDQLAPLLEALLLEIAAALAGGETVDDQGHD